MIRRVTIHGVTQNVENILFRKPPHILYHYTTQTGLLGIINGREIWASNLSYLNDAREFRHAVDIVREELSEMTHHCVQEHEIDRIGVLSAALKGQFYRDEVFVCSFSADGDVLSQWRAYGGGASGFAIGFSGSFLRKACEAFDANLVPVLYDEDEKRALVRRLLDEAFGYVQKACRKGGAERRLLIIAEQQRFRWNLLRFAPLLKHKSFSEENEWRIVLAKYKVSERYSERFDYRAGSSMLIPYVRIPLNSRKHSFNIREVIVGPTPHPDESTQSLVGLLAMRKLNRTTVRTSETPYRNW